MPAIDAKPQTLEQYFISEPNRLHGESLTEDTAYHLMMRNEGKGPEAYLTYVLLTNIRRELGRTAFGVIYTDADLRPVTEREHPCHLENDFWVPRPPLPLRSAHSDGVAKTGYFMPYDDGLDTEFLEAYQLIRESLAMNA